MYEIMGKSQSDLFSFFFGEEKKKKSCFPSLLEFFFLNSACKWTWYIMFISTDHFSWSSFPILIIGIYHETEKNVHSVFKD